MTVFLRNPKVLWKPDIDPYGFVQNHLVYKFHRRKCREILSLDKTQDCQRGAQCQSWKEDYLHLYSHSYISYTMDFVRILDPSKLVLAGTVSIPAILPLPNLSLTGHRLPSQYFCLSFIQFTYISLWMPCARKHWCPSVTPNREQLCSLRACASFSLPTIQTVSSRGYLASRWCLT